jgi:hypothetical protein
MTLRRLFLALALALTLFHGASARADTLPRAITEDLSGDPVDTQSLLSGTAAVVIVGFTRPSSELCQAWEDRLWSLHGNDVDCRILSVIPTENVPFFIMMFIARSVRERTPKERFPYVLLLKHGRAQWKRTLAYDKVAGMDDPYLVVVDSNQQMLWQGHGALSPDMLGHIEAQLERAKAVSPVHARVGLLGRKIVGGPVSDPAP